MISTVNFIFASQVLSLTAIFISAYAEYLALSNIEYIESLNLPPGADSLGLPLFSMLIGMFFIGLASIWFHVAAFIAAKNRGVKSIDIMGWKPSAQADSSNIIKLIVIILAGFLSIEVFLGYQYISFATLLADILSGVAFLISVLAIMSIISALVISKS